MPTLKKSVFDVLDPQRRIPEIFEGLDYVGGLDVEVPILTRMRRFRRHLGTELAEFNDVKRTLLKRHGGEGENLALSPASPGWNGFVADYNALLAETFEIPEPPLEMKDLALPGLRLKEKELRKLGPLFLWGDEEKKEEAPAAPEGS